MRRYLLPAIALLAVGVAVAAAVAQTPAPAKQKSEISRIFGDVLHQHLPGDSQSLSKGDVSSGLKQALTVSTNAVAKQIGARNGYFGDPKIRIPLPGVLGAAQKRLQPFGMSGVLDDLQLG